jgi:uncharacterized protein YbaA (DUF1428 family)
MRRLHLISLAAVWLLMVVVVAGCSGASTPAAPIAAPTATPAPTVVPTTESEPTTEATIDFESLLEEFDPNNFDDPTTIDNEWLPMQPGTQWVYEGFTEDSGLTIPHRIEFTVTDLTKEIEGVRTVVAWVKDYSELQLVEAELAFYAQDNDGTVWYLGEYPEEYENEQFVDAPAWIAGFKGARAGIKMRAEPQAGTPSYSQGWGPAVNWTDYGQVDQVGQETCVPVDCYDDVLVIAESSLEETDAFQLKYYARGVGEVRVGWRGADATKETLELTEMVQLSPEALAEIRAEALELEEHAYKISKEVYDQTPPSEILQATATEGEVAQETAAEDEPASEAPEPEFADFEPSNFERSTNIDNEWLPMQPGTHWVYEGVTTEDGESLPHRIEFTVTDLTKEIEGVRAVVAWIEDYSDGELVELEIAFYAQDDDGNVWYLGEYPEEYEDGKFVDAPTWIAGLEDARPGIKMMAELQLGTPSYFQGWAPAVEWSDYGLVDQMSQETCVPVDCYEDVLVIAESSLEETDAFQLKYYVRGVGEVRVGWRGADATQEELELVEYVQLSPEALADVRARALELEEHAYAISQEVYGQTLPAEGP